MSTQTHTTIIYHFMSGLPDLHDGDVAIVLPALHVKDWSIAVKPDARDVQTRTHQAPRVIAQVQDETLSTLFLQA